MRTKRGGYRHTKLKLKTPIPAIDRERVAAVSSKGHDQSWRAWGEMRPLEPLNAGVLRILSRRAPKHLRNPG